MDNPIEQCSHLCWFRLSSGVALPNISGIVTTHFGMPEGSEHFNCDQTKSNMIKTNRGSNQKPKRWGTNPPNPAYKTTNKRLFW